MPQTQEKRAAVLFDIWKLIPSSLPGGEEDAALGMRWAKVRDIPYFLSEAAALAELAQVLTAKDAAAKNHYKIVRHELTARMLEQDIACGKVSLA